MKTTPGPIALLVSSWSLFKAYWKPFVAIAGAASLVLYIGQIFLSSQGLFPEVIGAILTIAGGILSIALQPALITAVQKACIDPTARLSFVEQYKNGFRFFWPMLGLAILHGIIIVGGVMAFLIPAIIVEGYTCMYVFTRVVDGSKGLAAFTESYTIVKGRWWGTVGRMLFMAAIYGVFSIVVVGILFLIGQAAGFSLNSPGAEPFSGILNLVLNSFMMPLGFVYFYGLYASLKATRQQGVATAGFRKWLIFFIAVTCVVLVLMPLLGFGVTHLLSAPHPLP